MAAWGERSEAWAGGKVMTGGRESGRTWRYEAGARLRASGLWPAMGVER